MLRWGLFKSVVTEPSTWSNQTVATRGQLWDFNYRFTTPPPRIVTFRQSGTTLTISAAGSPVTITMGTGCVIHRLTPTTIRLPNHTLISPGRPDKIGHGACS